MQSTNTQFPNQQSPLRILPWQPRSPAHPILRSPLPGSRIITIVRVALALWTCGLWHRHPSQAHLLLTLGGGSKRDLGPCLRWLGHHPPRSTARPCAAVPAATAKTVSQVIARRQASGESLASDQVRAEAHANRCHVLDVLGQHQPRQGLPPVRYTSQIVVDDDLEEFVLLDDEDDAPALCAVANNGSGTIAPWSPYACEAFGQGTLIPSAVPLPELPSQVLIPSDCDFMYTPPRCARRNPIRDTTSAAARGASRYAGPSARHSGLTRPRAVQP